MSAAKVLFLCTGNSCRSQMAEGWARELRPDEIEAYSAGIRASSLNPYAVRVMQEAGVDISGQTSKTVQSVFDVPLDIVVSVCSHADETCPTFPGQVKRIHVPFDDPPHLTAEMTDEEEKLAVYRRVRDEIRVFIESLNLNQH